MDDIHVPLLSSNDSPVCMPSDRQQHNENPSIYRVPAYITSLKPEAYQPQVVSFGPYHYDEKPLPMEEHKHRVLDHFLTRSGKFLHPYLESLREVAQDLEDSYDMLDRKKWTTDKFLDLMIRDGCFMLEIMRNAVGENRDYQHNDPIFSSNRLNYITPYISRDMLLLENQLPMEVLYRLVKVESNGQEDIKYVNELVLKFYNPPKKREEEAKCWDWPLIKKRIQCLIFRVFRAGDPDPDSPSNGKDIKVYRCLHVLDVFRIGRLTKSEKNQHEEQSEEPEAGEKIIRSATDLREAGVEFKKSNTNSLKDISFSKGRLSLPAVIVEDSTETEFRNAMTFERLHIDVVGAEVTSYVVFMDNIINNEQDVALLHTKGIIQNDIGSNKAVANLFNSLCMEVALPSTFTHDGVQKEMSKYCKKPWNKWRAYLNRTYFGSPWTILSLIAAIFLFVLTIIQTVYAVLSYY